MIRTINFLISINRPRWAVFQGFLLSGLTELNKLTQKLNIFNGGKIV